MAHRRWLGDEQVLDCKQDPQRSDHFLVKLRGVPRPPRWWQRLLRLSPPRPAAHWVSMSQTQYARDVCYDQADTPQKE